MKTAERLSELVVAHERLHFPEHPLDDNLQDLLLELAEYDGYVIGLAQRAAQGDRSASAGIRACDLPDRIEQRAREVGLPDREARSIAAYVSSLRNLTSALRELARGPRRPRP